MHVIPNIGPPAKMKLSGLWIDIFGLKEKEIAKCHMTNPLNNCLNLDENNFESNVLQILSIYKLTSKKYIKK